MIRKKTILVILSAMTLTIMSCGKDNNDSQAVENTEPPVGTWSANESGTKSFFDINSDGTYLVAYYDGNNDNYKRMYTVETGYWNLDNTKTTISFAKTGGSASVYAIQTMNENVMVFLDLSSGATLSFQKRTDNYDASDFVGDWTCTKYYYKEIDRTYSNVSHLFKLRSDGTGIGLPDANSTESFTYYYMGGMLICRYNNEYVKGYRVDSKGDSSMKLTSFGLNNEFNASHYAEYWLSK